jgi:hypothetical protein
MTVSASSMRLPMSVCLAAARSCFPAGGLGHPEDVDLPVVVPVFQLVGEHLVVALVQEVIVGFVLEAAGQLGTPGGKGVGDVFEEDEAQHQVLVFGCVHVGAQLVGGRPEGLLDVVEHGNTWYRHWVRTGLEAFERQLAQGPAGAFCHGDSPTLADCCLVPQIFNARRFDTPLDGLPRTMAAFDACMALEAFQKAQPSACPDAQG